MKASLAALDTARAPVQERARERFERVLSEAGVLLLEAGLSGFSIPVLAERLGYTRGSVYAYFPTPYAILNALVLRDLAEMESVFFERADELAGMHWHDSVAAVVDHAVRFHNTHPVARLLILGGAVTDESHRALELSNKRLGELGHALWKKRGIDLPRSAPDVATLAADVGTACLRRSFFEHGEVTGAYHDAAVSAMIGFLAPYAEQACTRQASSLRAINA